MKVQKLRAGPGFRSQTGPGTGPGPGSGLKIAGLTKPGLRKPGLQNGRVGRPGPVPIPGYDPPKYNFQSRIIKFLASSIRISLFVAIIIDDDN